MRIVSLLFMLTLGLPACKKNNGCTQFGAENYNPDAVYNDGSCILARDKFIGLFQVSSNCFVDDYMRNITTTSDEYIVVISNLADTLGNVEAHVFGNNITIEQQTVDSFITIEGAGVYVQENNAISLSYRVRDNRTGTEVIHDCMEWCSKM